MQLPTRLTIYDLTYALDGGTTVLIAVDENGRRHSVRQVQHASPCRSPKRSEIPGRLYFDDELIAIRSDVEAAVLKLLQTAEFPSSGVAAPVAEIPPNTVVAGDDIRQVLTRSPDENLRAMTAAVVACVIIAASGRSMGFETGDDSKVQ